ncbi:MAG TPA: PilZ domain-containing protein, partial [Vicinamibacteria bacterium]|nr:PilZ domain-containing protein [Vicinamibacteria bacterium]
TTNVSMGGVSFALRRPVPMGQVLLLTLPLPELFRRYDLKAQTYRVYGLVRYTASEGPPFQMGVMFLGRHPPRGYEDNPSGLVLLPDDPRPSGDARAHPRHEVMVTLRLRRLEAPPGSPAEELTITEDVSLGGARVRTAALGLAKGEMVQLSELEGPFRAQALVLNVAGGADGIVRANLHFTHSQEAAAAARDLLRRQGITA